MNGTKAMLALVALACAASAGAASTPPAAAGVLVNLVRTDSASQGHYLTCADETPAYLMPGSLIAFRHRPASYWQTHQNPGAERTPECHRKLVEGSFFQVSPAIFQRTIIHYNGTPAEFRRALGQHPNHH